MDRETNITFFDRDTSFQGTVSTGKLILEGVIDGEVEATSKVHLKSGAVVSGAITTQKYILEDGSTHNGKVRLAPQGGSPREVPAPATPAPEPVGEPTVEKAANGAAKHAPVPVRTEQERPSRSNSDERLW